MHKVLWCVCHAMHAVSTLLLTSVVANSPGSPSIVAVAKCQHELVLLQTRDGCRVHHKQRCVSLQSYL